MYQPPSPGKAVIYFARVSAYGGAAAFDFFHNDRFIGICRGTSYIRCEVDPGEHLFWISTENKEFITADVAADSSYAVVIDVRMGAFKAKAGTTLVPPGSDLFPRVRKLINTRDAKITPEKKIEKTNKKLSVKFIPNMLQRYENEWKGKRNFRHISQDMAIAEEEWTKK